MNTFAEEDVVTFTDGNRMLPLWGQNVEVEYLHVIAQEGSMVRTALYDATYVFPASELVKIGEMYDTETNADGHQVFKWLINDEEL